MSSGKKEEKKKGKGKVVLMRKNVNFTNPMMTGVKELLGTGINAISSSVNDITKYVFFKLISAVKASKDGKGIVGKKTCLEKNLSMLRTLGGRKEEFDIHFEWDAEFGTPGAFYVENLMNEEFFLVSMTLEYQEDNDETKTIHFVCNSWVYNSRCYKTDRIFFYNEPYLYDQTPKALRKYREEELQTLRGDGEGKRKEWERIYDYDVYNDLGNPDKDVKLARPILGGSSTHPYPRRVRSGRKIIKKNDSKYEKPGMVYVPRDEKFSPVKSSDILAYVKKSIIQKVLPLLESIYLKVTLNEFNSFEEVQRLHEGGIKLPISSQNSLPLPTDGENVLQFPPPHVIQVSKSAWMTDEEFAREMIAGVNPCVIRRLQLSPNEFPPKSKLDPSVYGDQTSKMNEKDLETNLEGLTVDKAIEDHRLFILDYHDAFMPHLREINGLASAKAYATRTILFLKNDKTLKPLAIELSKPHPDGYSLGAVSKVVLPASEGVESTIWLLAKAHVIVNDSCYHQLISHWLNTHAVMEPFIIATNRHLSVLHPIYKLLHPHYRDTININGLARQSLISAGGIVEQSFLPGPYSMKMSSAAYENWVFTDQALPADLKKRGMTVDEVKKDSSSSSSSDQNKDSSSSSGLVIKDYPYAVDGLEIWNAIKSWVQEYVPLYYPTDAAVKLDTELQAWWKEAVEKGHADLKDKPWWPKMQNRQELIDTCTIIIWTASALHAAVNFGQYPYGGFILNRPTLSRRWIPEPGTPEHDEMEKNPHQAYLRTITPKYQTIIDLTVIEILSRHASDEVYLGQRDNPNWTSDPKAIEAFKKFGKRLAEIETKISERNHDSNLRNRTGPAQLPYTVLLPTSETGLTFRGIPNSISI